MQAAESEGRAISIAQPGSGSGRDGMVYRDVPRGCVPPGFSMLFQRREGCNPLVDLVTCPLSLVPCEAAAPQMTHDK
jgi:hypothetical protein